MNLKERILLLIAKTRKGSSNIEYCTIYLARHGESEDNRDELTGGDSQLTEKGRRQAAETKAVLADVAFDAVYSSDLDRAIETAAIIYGSPVPKANQLGAFRERAFGRLEGKPSADWFELMGTYERKYAALPFFERWGFEYGDSIENDKTMGERFVGAMADIAGQNIGKTILLAAHAGPIRVILMQLGYAEWLSAGSFRNAGFVELRYDGKDFTITRVVGVEDVDSPHS